MTRIVIVTGTRHDIDPDVTFVERVWARDFEVFGYE